MATAVVAEKQIRKSKYRADGADLLSAVPKDWTSEYRILVLGDFAPENQHLWYDWKIGILKNGIVSLEQEKAEFIKTGGAVARTKINKLKRMFKAMAALEAEVAGDGVDVAALKASTL